MKFIKNVPKLFHKRLTFGVSLVLCVLLAFFPTVAQATEITDNVNSSITIVSLDSLDSYYIKKGDILSLPDTIAGKDDSGGDHKIPVTWSAVDKAYDPNTALVGQSYLYKVELVKNNGFISNVALPIVKVQVVDKVHIVSFDALPILTNNFSAYRISAGDPLPLPTTLIGRDQYGNGHDVPVTWSPKNIAYDPTNGVGGIFFYTPSFPNTMSFVLDGAVAPTAEILVENAPSKCYVANVYVQTARNQYQQNLFVCPYLGAIDYFNRGMDYDKVWVRMSIFNMIRYSNDYIGTLDDGPNPTLRHIETGETIECLAIIPNPGISPSDCVFYFPGNATPGEWELIAHTVTGNTLIGRIYIYGAEEVLQLSDVVLEKTNPNDLSDRQFTFSCTFTNTGPFALNVIEKGLSLGAPVSSPALYVPDLIPVDPSVSPVPAVQFSYDEVGDLAPGQSVHLSKTVELSTATPENAGFRYAQAGIIYGDVFYPNSETFVLPYASESGYLPRNTFGSDEEYNNLLKDMLSYFQCDKFDRLPEGFLVPVDALVIYNNRPRPQAPKEPQTPKTGDENDFSPYVILSALALTCMFIMGRDLVYRKKQVSNR